MSLALRHGARGTGSLPSHLAIMARRTSLRRCQRASASAAPQHQPQPSRPAPTALQHLLLRYDTALKTHPVAVKALTSFVGFALGDWLAQRIEGLPFSLLR